MLKTLISSGKIGINILFFLLLGLGAVVGFFADIGSIYLVFEMEYVDYSNVEMDTTNVFFLISFSTYVATKLLYLTIPLSVFLYLGYLANILLARRNLWRSLKYWAPYVLYFCGVIVFLPSFYATITDKANPLIFYVFNGMQLFLLIGSVLVSLYVCRSKTIQVHKRDTYAHALFALATSSIFDHHFFDYLY